MNYPTVTIGFSARERFSLASKTLEAIYKHTHIPFNLIVIDCNIPSKYLNQMKKVLEGKSNVKIIHTDHFLQPNQARNLILAHTKDDYVAFVENDCFVSNNWLAKLITACEEFPAKAAIPLLLEGPTWRKNVHHQRTIGTIKSWQENGKTYHEFGTDLDIKYRYKMKDRQRVWSMETHFMFFKRDVFDQIGPFDEKLNTREPVDISLALYNAKIPIVLEPNVRVNFYPPPPVYKDELPFYHFAWDVVHGIESNKYMEQKWNIVNMACSVEFVKAQHHRTGNIRHILHRTPRVIAGFTRNLTRKLTGAKVMK